MCLIRSIGGLAESWYSHPMPLCFSSRYNFGDIVVKFCILPPFIPLINHQISNLLLERQKILYLTYV